MACGRAAVEQHVSRFAVELKRVFPEKAAS
jgi:hypothetical protein